jgi:hypothetical protein
MDSSIEALIDGALGPMFIAGIRRTAVREAAHTNAMNGTTEEGQLNDLRQAIRGTVSDPQTLHICMEAIDELQKTFTVAYRGLFQESLAIFAYFCVIAKRLEKNWWSEGWSSQGFMLRWMRSTSCGYDGQLRR